MKKYLVGGSVRDTILGREVHDRDFVIIGASGDEFLNAHRGAKKVGSNDCVYIYKGDEYTVSNLPDIHEDLLRRDLTINAFAKDEDDGSIISHPQASSDLENKVLRPIREENFLNDPLRVFRAARFAAELPGFRVHPELIRIMTHVSEKGLLGSLAAERVGNEVIKACSAASPGRFLRLLSETSALTPWLQEFEGTAAIAAGPSPFHNESLLEHTAAVMDKLAGSPSCVWMGLCHDIGKAVTPEGSLPAHHGHGDRGKDAALAIGTRLKLPARFTKAGVLSSEKHMAAAEYEKLKPGTKVRLLMMLKRHGILRDMFEVVFADKGVNYIEQAEQDVQRILSVRLPEKFRGMGQASGEKLFQLQCQTLKKR